MEILLVEDDEDVRDAMRELLQDEGYAVLTAANGREALDMLEADSRPTLILLDMHMPVMDGKQFREAQKGDPRFAKIPVIAFSAGRDPAWIDAAAVIQKPVDLDKLLEVVARFE